MPKLQITVDVDETTGRWSLQAESYPADLTDHSTNVAFLEGHGFGPEEVELGAALDHLDRVFDPSGDELAVQAWWADTWAHVLSNVGLGAEGRG